MHAVVRARHSLSIRRTAVISAYGVDGPGQFSATGIRTACIIDGHDTAPLRCTSLVIVFASSDLCRPAPGAAPRPRDAGRPTFQLPTVTVTAQKEPADAQDAAGQPDAVTAQNAARTPA